MPHGSFVSRYALLLGSEWLAAHAEEFAHARQAVAGDERARTLCQAALVKVIDDAERYQLGKTKVYMICIYVCIYIYIYIYREREREIDRYRYR